MDKKKRCFIVSVGSSLIVKYNEEISSSDIKIEILEALNSSDDWKELWKKWKKKLWKKWKEEKPHYRSASVQISEWLISKNSPEQFKKCSAELNTLFHIEPPPNNNDKIILIATRTPTGKLCSDILKDFLKKKVGCIIKRIYPEGLGKADDNEFATKGLPNFISCISKIIQENEKDYEIILIPTGGYKSLIPYSTLAGILHEKEVKYIYEDSENLLTLPSLPLNLDIEKWKPNYLKLEILTTQPQKNTAAYYDNLDSSFKNLLKAPTSKDEPYKFNVFGEFLRNRYLQLRYKTPLQFQTRGTSLLKYLKRDTSPDLIEFFSQLVNIGPYLWIGDKVPEMAEHAQYHHTNLFEIAETILLPILENDNNFLTPEELFVLLCTIYFHDCGHVLDSLSEKPLLPMQIRDYHHILGYERIKDQEWRKKLIENGLKWTDNDAEKLWDDYLKVIAKIGLYHRKKMPLQEEESPYFCPINEEKYHPLKSLPLKFEGNIFSPDKAVLIASLFRIIDSLDTQFPRLGTEEEIRMKAAVVLNDVQTEERRKDMIEKMVKEYLLKDELEKIDGIIAQFTSAYKEKETTGTSSTGGGSKQEIDIEQELDKIFPCDEFKKTLAKLYIEAYCKVFFKKEQPKHYLKHLSFEKINISYQFSNQNHIIKIQFIPQKPGTLGKYRDFFELKEIPAPEKIKKDIEEEYEKVKSILNKARIFITYEISN